MAKIARATQKQFGSTAGTNKMAKFGSLAAGTPARYNGTTVTPALIQALSNFLSGWEGAVLGNNSPPIEDMNALCYLFAYQIGYVLQTGVAEYDASTTYFIGSVVNDGTGVLYVSKTDTNLGNALTVTANWEIVGRRVRTTTTTDSATALDRYLRLDPTGATYTETLPAVATTPVGTEIRLKNIATNGNQVTVKGNAAENIDGANTVVLSSLDAISLINNGTSWDIF